MIKSRVLHIIKYMIKQLNEVIIIKTFILILFSFFVSIILLFIYSSLKIASQVDEDNLH